MFKWRMCVVTMLSYTTRRTSSTDLFKVSLSFSLAATLIHSHCTLIGVEGTKGVSCMAVSHSKKYLAVCERASQAICFVYELNTLKRRRVITSSESSAQEFVDVKFAYSEEKLTNFLFTLVSRSV